ncbi:MAG: hypothetical protein JNK23_18155 [Opitutaceae bacterium]|nr:hypothetical protein [Opitutaceae bacterium]
MDFSKEAPVVFDPRDRAHRRKLWVRVATPTGDYYHVFWPRVAAACAALALVAWLSLAAAAWGYLKFRRGYRDVSYLNLVFYPWQRAEHQIGLGHHYIAAGRAAWERQEYREAYALLLAGLARVPGDLTARRYIAIIEMRIGRPERAVRTLLAGVEHARGNLEYLRLVFSTLLEVQEDERAVELARQLLPAVPDYLPLHQFVALQGAIAHYHRGRLTEAERIVAEWRLDRILEGQLLLARCDWQRDRRPQALARLVRMVPQFPKRDDLYVELVRWCRELGRPDEARRYALIRQFNNPGSAGARIDVMHAYRDAGDTAAERRELASYIADFAKDQSALVLLAWFAVDTAQPGLADQAHTLAKQARLPLPVFELSRVQSLIAAKDYAAAVALTESPSRPTAASAETFGALMGALRAVALFGAGDLTRAQVALGAFVEGPRVRANDLLLVARQLKSLGQTGPARRVVARACELDPRNEPALVALVQLDAELGDRVALAENLPRLFGMRRHHRATLEQILRALTDPADAPLRRQIEDALAQPD